MDKFIKHLVKNSKVYFIGSLLILFVFASQIRNCGFDSAFETIGIQDDKYMDNLEFVDSLFSLEERILVEVIPQEGNFWQIQRDMLRFEDQLKIEFDSIQVRSWLKTLPSFYNKSTLEKMPRIQVLKRYKKMDLFHNLIGSDLKSFILVFEVHKIPTPLALERYYRALGNTDFELDYKFNVTSVFHIENAINQSIIRDIFLIIGLLLLFFVIIMYIAYRNIFSIIYLLLLVVLSMIASVGVHALLGAPFNLITINVIPVIIVLAAANAVHLLTGFYAENSNKPKSDRIKNVLNKYLLPSLLTSCTTAVAFFSLMFNRTTSVYNLGWITGISVIISFLLVYGLTPLLFRFAKPKEIRNNAFKKVAQYFIDKRKFFSFVLIPILLFAIILLPRLTFKNNFELFFPLNAPEKLEHDNIKANYSSQATLDILLTLNDSVTRNTILEKIQKQIQDVANVGSVKSSVTKSIFMTKYLVPIDLSKTAGYAKQFSTDNGNLQRILLHVKEPDRIIQIEKEIIQILEENNQVDYKISSLVLAYDNVNSEVGRSLMQSLLSSSLFLFIVFFWLTRSILLAMIGLFANLVPLSLIVIIFVLFDYHINILTAITAVVCLGIIVDDTIHSFYRRIVKKQELKELSFGMLTTTLILTIGFGVFMISDVRPVRIFGGVAAAVFIVTLISDFTLLLYLNDLYEKYIEKKDNKLEE